MGDIKNKRLKQAVNMIGSELFFFNKPVYKIFLIMFTKVNIFFKKIFKNLFTFFKIFGITIYSLCKEQKYSKR